MRQRKALLALAILLALLTFNTEVQAKGGRSGGGGRSSGSRGSSSHRSSSGGGGWFSWGSKSKSSSSSNNGHSSHSTGGGGGGGLFSNWGDKSKTSSSTSHKTSDSKPAPPIGWNVGNTHDSHAHKHIKPTHVSHNHGKASHHTHAQKPSYPRQPVYIAAARPGLPPPPPPPNGGYYASSQSLPVGAVYYPQVPRTSSDAGFDSGFFAGAYGQSILHRLSHPHYHHTTVIHHHHHNDNTNNNNNNNNDAKDTIIIINNNPTNASDLEQAKTTTTPLAAIQPVLTNDITNASNTMIAANSTNLAAETTVAAALVPTIDSNAVDTVAVDTVAVDANASTTAATLNDNNANVAANDVANNAISTAAAPAPAPGGIICFPTMVNETDPQDPSKVLQVEKIVCFPAQPPTAEELQKIEQEQHQPPEQPNILQQDNNDYLDVAVAAGALQTKGHFQLAAVPVVLLLLLSRY